MSERPSAAERLRTPGALLIRSDLRDLGLERRAIDAVFRALPIVSVAKDPTSSIGAYTQYTRGSEWLERAAVHSLIVRAGA